VKTIIFVILTMMEYPLIAFVVLFSVLK